MPPRRVNPFGRQVPDAVVEMLLDWVAAREAAGAPKSPRPPEGGYRWNFGPNGELRALGDPAGNAICVRMPRGSFRRPGLLMSPWVLDFGKVFFGLRPAHRVCLLAFVDLCGQPWLKGKKWRRCLKRLGLTRPKFSKILKNAFQSLAEGLRGRNLI